jgi:hypothetical protein
MNLYSKENRSKISHILDYKKILPLKKYYVSSRFVSKILGNKYVINQSSRKLLAKHKLSFSAISNEDQLKINLDILKKLKKNSFTKSGRKKKIIWDKGWNENFVLYKKDLKKLLPKYYRKTNRFFRIKGKIIYSQNYKFDAEFQEVIHLTVISRYLKNIKNIYEFGAGSGNVIARLMKNLNMNFQFYASDWSEVSVNILKKINIKRKKIKTFLFNFFNPNQNISIEKKSLIITNGALEQTGTKYEKFVKYLIKNKPKIVINFEPLVELYDNNNFNDHVLKLYAKKRNYLSNYIEYLKKLEQIKLLKIIDLKRVGGGAMQETFSFVVWRPL